MRRRVLICHPFPPTLAARDLTLLVIPGKKIFRTPELIHLAIVGESRRMEVSAGREENRIFIAVRDCGLGIPVSEQERIF